MFLAINEANILLFLKNTEKKRIFIKSLKKKSLLFRHNVAFLGTFNSFFKLKMLNTFCIFIVDFKLLEEYINFYLYFLLK